MNRELTVANVVDLVVRLEEDAERRYVLDNNASMLFQAAVADGIADPGDIDMFANVFGQGVHRGLLGFSHQHRAAHLPPPSEAWTLHAFHSRGGYFSTVEGQRMVTLRRQREQIAAQVPASSDPAVAVVDEPPAIAAPTVEPEDTPREYWTKMLRFAFNLPAASRFPALRDPVGDDDARVLRRYVVVAHELETSAVLNAADLGYTVTINAGVASVDSRFATPELTRGMAAGFRQLYAPGEKASFNVAMSRLQRAVREQGAGAVADQIAELAAWVRAAGKLRAAWLPDVMLERAKELNMAGLPMLPLAPTVVYHDAPENLLSVFLYGDLIHWDSGAAGVDALSDDPVADAHARFHLHAAVAQLGWLYVEFADVVEAAIGGLV